MQMTSPFSSPMSIYRSTNDMQNQTLHTMRGQIWGTSEFLHWQSEAAKYWMVAALSQDTVSLPKTEFPVTYGILVKKPSSGLANQYFDLLQCWSSDSLAGISEASQIGQNPFRDRSIPDKLKAGIELPSTGWL
jgi:hypothetical protein